ncbi:MAG: hypothetical protein IC227_01965 [Enterococcus lacertideformus]|uniref:Uncharacterized protein n=1 Tax=Enterococcus lacertideformus TaxID=2771493 RepID=A0A931F969_9ENTE|nr:hypothetical protein [Enterococcus lacertideformus]
MPTSQENRKYLFQCLEKVSSCYRLFDTVEYLLYLNSDKKINLDYRKMKCTVLEAHAVLEKDPNLKKNDFVYINNQLEECKLHVKCVIEEIVEKTKKID